MTSLTGANGPVDSVWESPAAPSRIVLGIDPGVNGAIAVLTDAGDLLGVEDMPTLPDGAKGRQALNAPLLANMIRRAGPSIVYCELVNARPTDGVVGSFGFGRSRGVIEGVCGALGVPVVMVTPQAWKRAAGIPPGLENKDQARARAVARWPSKAALFARKMDCDRAEAALCAIVGTARLSVQKSLKEQRSGTQNRFQ